MNAVHIDPIGHPLWSQLVMGTESSVFHSTEWMRVLSETYSMDIEARVLLDEQDNPVAGLPYCGVNDLKGTRKVTLPFSDYCDPLAAKMQHWHGLVDHWLQQDAALFIRCVHNPLPLQDSRLHCYNQAKWHGLDLRPDLETLWRRLDGSARRAVRKAQQNSVEVRAAQSKDELRTFYELHLGIRKYKYRLLAQPYRFFESIWDHFIDTGHGTLLLASQHGQVIGGTLFLQWKDALFYKFNASVIGGVADRPNDLLIWEGILWGKAHGCSSLDFGLSDWDQDGLIRYKRKFADQEKTISFLRSSSCERPTEQEQQIRALLPRLTELLTDDTVPDAVTERAGELLYRHFL